ncbi:esterase family protein [Deinococcus detaillensis]|uniref:Esterase family protein n=1 Tax=Deinococcus detaillensis TaxID=2592048 RepID=A0A553UUH5_9DEIO|nr:esterase family protein [Deinococcus detaillensis]TSA83860.1 esterase family protein [Deinococcus detaillensis]
MAVSVAGTHVTFTPPTGATALLGDFTDWLKQPPLPVVGGQPITLTLPRGAWVEYAWLDAAGQPFADPDNSQKSLNPWWNYPRAAEVGEYPRHWLWQGDATNNPAQRGEAHRMAWEGRVFSGKRRGYVYTPPGYDAARSYPVYYIQDGVAFYRTGKLSELLDRALVRDLIDPAILVFVEPLDRNAEYYLNERYFDFLQSEVLEQVEQRFSVSREAAGRGLWGASLGGLISLYTAWQHPDVFSKVISHSGAFIAAPDGRQGSTIDTTSAGEWLREQLQLRPPTDLQLSLDTGTLEWLLSPNRRMAAALQDLNIRHQYREYPSGHNWVTWQNALPEALLYMQGR